MKPSSRLPMVCLATLVFCGLASLSTLASSGALPPDLTEAGWEEVTFDGKRPNRYRSCGDDCIRVESEGSVSMIGREVSVDLTQTPYLRWQWKIASPVVPTNLAAKGQDDRAVAIYIAFAYDPATATLSERLSRPMVELLHGKDAPGRVISYVWAGHGAQGDVVESPYFGDANIMIICRNGDDPVGQWVDERFDIVSDHQRLFGDPPTSITHVLFASDSDDTDGKQTSHVRELKFSTD